MYNLKTVEAGTFGVTHFPKGRYTLEVDKAGSTTTADGRPSAWILFRIRGERYDNRTVLVSITFTENSLKALKALVEHFNIKGNIGGANLEGVRDTSVKAFNNAKGNRGDAIVFEGEDFNGKDQLIIDSLVK